MTGMKYAGIVVFYAGMFAYMFVYAMRPTGVSFRNANHKLAYAWLAAGAVLGGLLFFGGN
jgi:hypothetical protein